MVVVHCLLLSAREVYGCRFGGLQVNDGPSAQVRLECAKRPSPRSAEYLRMETGVIIHFKVGGLTAKFEIGRFGQQFVLCTQMLTLEELPAKLRCLH